MKDYLKFYKIVYWYTKKMYNISSPDLDIILFLYSERYFSEEKFREYSNIFAYNFNVNTMTAKGLIMLYAKRHSKNHIYQLTPHAIKIIQFLYRTLEGKPISMRSSAIIALKRRKTPDIEKKYLNKIFLMNKYIKDKRANPDKYYTPPII